MSESDARELERLTSLTPSQELGSMASVLAALARTETISLAPGTLIADQYRIERPIGEGGMGAVFLARDVHLDRAVAVKVCTGLSPSAVHRIQREAITLAKLAHPNVVVLYQAGELRERFFIAMEYVEGCNAREWLEREPRTWREIIDVYVQAARGLEAAHRVGIVHRDFKPDNVLVGRDGRVRVADFGLARTADAPMATSGREGAGVGPSPSPDDSLTCMVKASGTPAYMAPEQREGRSLDAAADQFSFCVALHEALWGVRPSHDASVPDLHGGLSSGEPPRPSAPRNVPRRLHEIVRRGLAPDPLGRWPDMHALIRALLADPGARRRRLGLGVAGLVVVGTSAWVAGNIARPEPCTGVGSAIESAWNEERRDEVAASLQRTGSPFAASALEPVTTELDAWATEWRAQRQRACEATRVHGEQSEARMDERMDCLDRVRVEGAAIVDVLRSADREVVVRAPTMVERLPDPSRCSDADALEAAEPVPAARRAVYDPLHARLAEATATFSAGRAEQAHAQVDPLIAEAENEGFSGLAARARRLRGEVRLELRREDEAVTDASSAITHAVQVQDDELLASASLVLATTLGRTPSATDEALRWLEICAAASARRSHGSVREANIASARVQILFFGDRFSEAERAARDALAALPEDDATRFPVLSMLGAALQRQSRPDEAIATHREAIAFLERVGRGEHPSVAAGLSNLAQSLQAVGRGAEAFPLIQRALAIRVAAYGEGSPAVADSYRTLADAYLDAGDLPAARKEYEHALAIHRAHHDEAGQVFTLGNLAIVLNGLGDVAGGRDLLLDALPMAERRFGATSRRVAELSINLSWYLLELGETGEAAAYGEKALALAERLGAESPVTIGACMNLAQIYGRQRRTGEALALLDRAAELNAAMLPPNAPEHAYAMLSRAAVLRDAGLLEKAAEEGVRAAESMERALGPGYHKTIEAQYLAGQDLLASGSTERARDLLERALEATGSTTVAPALALGIRWALAQALGPGRGQRARALELARSAHDGMRALGDARADEIEAWLASAGRSLHGPRRAAGAPTEP